MALAIYLVTAFCLLATLMPLVPSNKWWIRGFDFIHAQICFLTLVGLLCGLYFLQWDHFNWIILGVLLICFIYQFKVIYPYTPLSRPQVLTSRKDTHSLSLLSCNVYMENDNINALLVLVADLDPDVLLLVEPDKRWFEQTIELRKKYPYSVSYPLDNTYGMILYSRKKLLNSTINFLVENDIPSIQTTVEITPTITAQLHCLHPAPPAPDENQSTVERDAELLLVAQHVDAQKDPTIVMGDLNDVAWSQTTKLFQRISGLLDPRIGRGFYNTFHASYPFFRWPLDHFFHSNHFELMEIKRGPHIGSDHFPIYIKLSYNPMGTVYQQVPEADDEDFKKGQQKIQQAKS